MKQPLISIIIPIYNVEKYINKCLRSVVDQTYKKIEIICINDGSSDGSVAIVKQYQNKDSRVKLIDQANKGLSEARHTGVKHAKGSYLMFVDSDDLILPETIEIALNALLEHDVDITIFGYNSFVDGRVDSQTTGRIKIVEDPTKAYLTNKNYGVNVILATAWGKLYKAELLVNIDWELIRFRINEDEPFVCYPFSRAKKGAVILDRELYRYRQNPDSITRSEYKNSYRGRSLTRFQYIEELFKVQNKILGVKYVDYVLSYSVNVNFGVYRTGLLNLNHVTTPTNDDTNEFRKNVDSKITRYLKISDSIIGKEQRHTAEIYKNYGYSGLISYIIKNEISNREQIIKSQKDQVINSQKNRIMVLEAKVESFQSIKVSAHQLFKNIKRRLSRN